MSAMDAYRHEVERNYEFDRMRELLSDYDRNKFCTSCAKPTISPDGRGGVCHICKQQKLEENLVYEKTKRFLRDNGLYL